MRLITEPKERKWCQERFKSAAVLACNSVCRKSGRGVTIIRKDGRAIGVGWSRQTDPSQCENCPRIDNHSNGDHHLCLEIHAEQEGIHNALADGYVDDLPGSRMFHVKVDPETGKIKPSSVPSCTWCSRYLKKYRIFYYLLHNNGGSAFEDWDICEYSPEEINEISLENALKNSRR